MRDKELRKKYPKMWRAVYDNTMFELKSGPYIGEKIEINHRATVRVAHNAAFIACAIHHEMMREKAATKTR
jgi:hypothetical protein